jgi:ABC-type transport system substrate-binding protein
LLASRESGFIHTDFNMADPRIGYHPDPDQNARNHALRCAINKAFDWRRRNEIFFYDLGQVFPGIIPPVAPEYDPDADTSYIERDVEGALALLQRYGWHADNLPVLEYGFPGKVIDRQMFEQFRSFMADIGYPGDKVRALTYASFGDFARAYLNREVMLVTQSWIMDYPDAENTMQLYFGPNATPGTNTANYQNSRYDELYRRSAQMQPSGERTAMYREMNRILQEDCATVSGLSRTLILMWAKRLAMVPDRGFLGGHYFRFVDARPEKGLTE